MDFEIDDLLRKTVSGLGDISDIFTDDHACASAVARAENLIRLARLLSRTSQEIGEGKLYVNGKFIATVKIDIDGRIRGRLHKDLDYRGADVEIEFYGAKYRVNAFINDANEDATQLVIDEPDDRFYGDLLS